MPDSLKNLALIAAVATIACATTAAAQSSIQMAPQSGYLLEEYVTYIGDFDLRNSSSVRLTQPWAIIRQDRANFHRYGQRDGRLDQVTASSPRPLAAPRWNACCATDRSRRPLPA